MNSRAARVTFVLASLLAATPAAARRISLGAIQGERDRVVSQQLADGLCQSYECVPRKQVTTGGKVDFAKMKAHKVSAFLFGSVTRKGGEGVVWLAVLRNSNRPSRTWTLPLGSGGKLEAAALAEVQNELEDLLGGGVAPPAASPPTPAAQAPAATTIVLGAVSGKGAEPVTRQLSATLCSRYECVPRSRAVTKGKVDRTKMAQNGVAGFFFGSVTGSGANRSLWLELTTAPGHKRSWKLPLTSKGKLSAASTAELTAAVDAELGATAPPEVPAAVPPEAPPAVVEPTPAPAAAPPPPPPPAQAAAPPVAPVETKAAPKPARRKQYLIAVEAGAFGANRNLSYSVTSGGQSPVAYTLSFTAGPWVGAEFFPLTLLGDGLASGVGLVVNYGTTIGLDSNPPTGSAIPTVFWWLRAGVEWRLRPIAGSEFAIIPAVSYLTQRFTLSPPYTNLPNIELQGIEASLKFEIPVLPVLSILAGGGYVYWSSGQELVGTYFPSGSAWAFEFEAGLSVRVFGPLSVRGLGFYSQTNYSLTPTSTFQVTGAKDWYAGGRLTLRAEF